MPSQLQHVPRSPFAKHAEILTRAKPPAASHAHHSRSLFAIATCSHEDAKRLREGVPERYPSTQGTTRTCLPPDALLAAVPRHKQSQQLRPKGKAYQGSSQTFFASSERRRHYRLILSGLAGRGGEHQPTHSTASSETCHRSYRGGGNGS